MVVGQVDQVDAACRQEGGESGGAAEVVQAVLAVGLIILEDIFQVDQGQVILRKDVRKARKRPAFPPVFDKGVKGIRVFSGVLLAAQHAVAPKGQGDDGFCALGMGALLRFLALAIHCIGKAI